VQKPKAARLMKIEDLLLAHPKGLLQSEIARLLEVNRSTVNRYLPDLPQHIYIDDMDGSRWKIDRQAYLVNVRFNLNEAMAVHLASRLMATRMDRSNPHAASALNKLGLALQSLAPLISRYVTRSAIKLEGEDQKQDPVYLQALEKLTLAWAESRKVQVWHRSDRNHEIKTYVYSPYYIEPYAIGQSTYVFGFSEPPGEIRTFKIERIERVELLRETYSIPEDFDPFELLSDAWGIWYTSGEPEQVTLLFQQRAAQRVGETRWHRSEQVQIREDGRLLWRALIDEPREMLPWVRGWGADVEVLEPEWMRKEIRQEVFNMVKIYQIDT
jgi:predicted DNA-binding transcriptional regulator YafY